jgi:methionyl-tRNA formyltransferase
MGLRLAIFGQARFGREVTEALTAAGHEVVGVWVPPDNGRADPLGALALERGWPLFRHARYSRKGRAIPEVVAEYKALAPDLNVLPYTMAILPPEISDHPVHGSVCFHPSLLPAFRGGASLSWQIILGARESGVTVFKITERIDKGPILIQRGGVRIDPTDTMASLYFDKLYPLGVEVMIEAVAAIASGEARYRSQSEEGVSAQGLIDDETARIDWRRPATEIERLIRGCDPLPGALTTFDGRPLRCFGGSLGPGTGAGAGAGTGAGTGAASDSAPGGAAPGTVLGLSDGVLEVAARPGVVRVERVALDGNDRESAAAAGLRPGDRLGC